MENAEEIQQLLEQYSRTKPKEIPEKLEGYLKRVAQTGELVFQWPDIQALLREKLINVITEFYETTPSIQDLPHFPNVDPFNFEAMKKMLLERLDSFHSAPFTVQRICELLTEPRKQYTRIDCFMRAIEKTILVVSCVEPKRKRTESENGEAMDTTYTKNGETENGHANGNKENEEPPKPIVTEAAAEEEIALEKLEPEVSVVTDDAALNIPVVADSAVVEETSVIAEVETVAAEKDLTDSDAALPVVVAEPEIDEPMAKVEEPKTEETPTPAAEEAKEQTETTESIVVAEKPSPSKRAAEDEADTSVAEEIVTKKQKLDDDAEAAPAVKEQEPIEVAKVTEAEKVDEPDTTEAKTDVPAAVAETVSEVTEPVEVSINNNI